MRSDEIIEKIRNKFQNSNPEKRTIREIFQFEFTDANEKCIKKMVFDFNELNIYEGMCESAVAKIIISDDDFYLIETHKATFEELMTQKKVQVEGNSEAINKFMDKFRVDQKIN